MQTPLRRRNCPPTPFLLTIEDETGKQDISFQLAYDINALCLVEEVTGLSLLTDIQELFQTPNLRIATALFWAAIQKHHPDYEGLDGLRAVREMLSLSDMLPVLTKCCEAFVNQLPKEQAAKIRKAQEAAEENPLAKTSV